MLKHMSMKILTRNYHYREISYGDLDWSEMTQD